MYCLRCGEPISLLGLLDRETRYNQYVCSGCNTVYLQNSNGLIFPKDELIGFPEQPKSEEAI